MLDVPIFLLRYQLSFWGVIMKNIRINLLGTLVLGGLLLLDGCTGVNTFPTVARPGDTVSVMIGGSEKARTNTVDAKLTDATGKIWDLKTLGLVRSVFNLRPEGVAYGAHYSSNIETYVSWSKGHEPVQTVLVADIPSAASVGPALLNISLNTDDNSSGVTDPAKITLEIISGTGGSDSLLRKDVLNGGNAPVEFSGLESAPYAKIIFGNGLQTTSPVIGAASLVVDFNEAVVNPNDINVYAPESEVRGDALNAGSFGKTQRMVYWHQDGKQLYIDILAPQGIVPAYLQVYIVHPRGLIGSPAFNILSAQVYGTDGNAIALTPALNYLP